jgi:hypothetical protein
MQVQVRRAREAQAGLGPASGSHWQSRWCDHLKLHANARPGAATGINFTLNWNMISLTAGRSCRRCRVLGRGGPSTITATHSQVQIEAHRRSDSRLQPALIRTSSSL